MAVAVGQQSEKLSPAELQQLLAGERQEGAGRGRVLHVGVVLTAVQQVLDI